MLLSKSGIYKNGDLWEIGIKPDHEIEKESNLINDMLYPVSHGYESQLDVEYMRMKGETEYQPKEDINELDVLINPNNV